MKQKQFSIVGIRTPVNLDNAKRSSRLTVALEPELKEQFVFIARRTPMFPLASNASNLARILIAAHVKRQGIPGVSRARRTA